MTDGTDATFEAGDAVIYRDPDESGRPKPARVVRALEDGRYRISLEQQTEDAPNRLAAGQMERLDETMTNIAEGPFDPVEDREVDASTLERAR